VVRGEKLIKPRDSWFSAKSILVERIIFENSNNRTFEVLTFLAG